MYVRLYEHTYKREGDSFPHKSVQPKPDLPLFLQAERGSRPVVQHTVRPIDRELFLGMSVRVWYAGGWRDGVINQLFRTRAQVKFTCNQKGDIRRKIFSAHDIGVPAYKDHAVKETA